MRQATLTIAIKASCVVCFLSSWLPFFAQGEQIGKTSQANASLKVFERGTDRYFYQGLADSCEIDLDANSKTKQLKSDMKDRFGVEKYSICVQSLFRNCTENLSEVRKAVGEKAYFISNPEENPIFPWSEGQKLLYLDTLTAKICSGAVSLKTLKSLDALFFSNTPCTGDEYLNELPQIAKLRVDHLDGTNLCANGWNGKIGTKDGTHVDVMIVGGSSRTLHILKPDGKVLTNLDETIFHEFTHRREDIDPVFKAETKEFVGKRFSLVKSQFDVLEDNFTKTRRQFADHLAKDESLSDDDRTLKLGREVDRLAESLSEKMAELKVPVRMGLGSDNGVILKEVSADPNSWRLGNGLNFVNGKVAPVGNNGVMIDIYMLSSEHEYIATAMALFRYDRNSAEKMFTQAELEWLRAKNNEPK